MSGRSMALLPCDRFRSLSSRPSFASLGCGEEIKAGDRAPQETRRPSCNPAPVKGADTNGATTASWHLEDLGPQVRVNGNPVGEVVPAGGEHTFTRVSDCGYAVER